MVEKFEAANKEIKVDVELVPYNDYFTKLQTLMAGSQAPDVFELNYENFVSYAEKRALLNLDKYIAEDQNFDSKTLNKEAFEAYQYDGKQYGMVESFSNVVTFIIKISLTKPISTILQKIGRGQMKWQLLKTDKCKRKYLWHVCACYNE